MSQVNSGSEDRTLYLEYRLNELLARLAALEARVAGDEQTMAQVATSVGDFASVSWPAQPALVGGSAFTAASGTTPGSASVTPYALSGGVLVAGSAVTCYSIVATNPTAAGKWIMVDQDQSGNTWEINEVC